MLKSIFIINGIQICRVFAQFVAIEPVDALRGNHEPGLVLVCRCDDGVVVIQRVGGWVGLVIDEFLDLDLVFFGGEGSHSADGHVGDAVAVHVGVWIVGNIIVDVVFIGISQKDERESGYAIAKRAINKIPIVIILHGIY